MEPMHVIMSFNSKYLMPALVTIYSLFKNNEGIVLHVLYIDLTDSERRCVERFFKMNRGHQIIWHYVTDDMKDKIHFDTGRFSIYTLYRFYAYQYLDESVSRCLWLDSDLMIRGSIRELYDTDMGDKWYFTGALESSQNVIDRFGEGYKYTNAGVLLMNLEKLRSDDMMDRFWDFLFAPDFDMPLLEQDALNVVFEGKIKFVDDAVWNRFPLTIFIEDVLQDVIEQEVKRTRIVHFVSDQKIWIPECCYYWERCAESFPFTRIMVDEYWDYQDECIAFLEANA